MNHADERSVAPSTDRPAAGNSIAQRALILSVLMACMVSPVRGDNCVMKTWPDGSQSMECPSHTPPVPPAPTTQPLRLQRPNLNVPPPPTIVTWYACQVGGPMDYCNVQGPYGIAPGTQCWCGSPYGPLTGQIR
jgi:hypothetical protein